MNDSEPKIVVLGSINMDLVIRCDQLPLPGQTILADSSSEFCGGKGANQAVAASLAGGDVAMIGAVGQDAFANRLIGNLESHSIDHANISQREQASGVAVITVDGKGQNSIVVVPGANAAVTPEDVESHCELIRTADVLLVQLEIPTESVLRGMEIAADANVRVILDPAPAPHDFPKELLHADLICPNESEASSLTGLSVNSAAEAELAAAELHQQGARNVAITMGEQGTLLFDGKAATLVPAFSVDAIDTTAAGDAFAGALAVQWLRCGNLLEAVRFANAAGALAASKRGAQASMASFSDITKLLRS